MGKKKLISILGEFNENPQTTNARSFWSLITLAVLTYRGYGKQNFIKFGTGLLRRHTKNFWVTHLDPRPTFINC